MDIFLAVSKNDLEKLKALIGSLSLSNYEANGYILLCTACKNGYDGIAEYLLSRGCNVNIKNKQIKSTKTPLHYAAIKGSTKIIEMLLVKGALVNVVDDCKKTPLYWAVVGNYEKIVALLLLNGARLQINECFYVALFNSNTSFAIIEFLLKYGASVNSRSCDRYMPNWHPIKLAASRGSNKLFMFSMAKDFNKTVKGSDGETLLHVTAEKGLLPIVQQLVKQGASVNSVTLPSYKPKESYYSLGRTCPSNVKSHGNSELGFTPLHLAVLNNNCDVVKFLLYHGSNLDDQEKNGRTALHIAVENDYDSLVELLLSYNPDINNKGNKNVLVDAVILNKNNSKIAQRLLDYGFSFESEYCKSAKLLSCAVQKGLLKVLEELIKCGAEVNTTGENNYLLHTAVKNKYIDICNVLLSKKVDVNRRDDNGNAPIHYAIQNQDICELLIKYKADVNIKDKKDVSPVVYSIEEGNFNVTKLLLDNGAVIKDGIIDCFNTAIEKGCLKIVELILERDKNFNVNAFDIKGRNPLLCTVLMNGESLQFYLYYICRDYCATTRVLDNFDNTDNNRNSIAKLLLTRGADVNSMSKFCVNQYSHKHIGFTALFAAAKNGFKEVVETLLEHNADVNRLNSDGYTALHVATSQGHVEIVDILLKFGSDPKLKCSNGFTALHIACLRGHDQIVDILLRSCISIACTNVTVDNPLLEFVNSKSRSDITPLMNAVRKGFRNIAETLLNFGADVNAEDNNGETALHIASEAGQYKLINLLLKFGGDINSTTKDGHSPVFYALKGADEFRTMCDNRIRNFCMAYDRVEYVGHNKLSSKFGCKTVYMILRNHIRKLSIADLYLSDKNLVLAVDETGEALQDVPNQSLDDCHDELNMMKKYVIVSNISYYDLATKTVDQLAVLAKNKILLQSFNSYDYDKLFPIYSDIIHSRFQMGIKRRDLLEESGKCLCSVNSELSRLPLICIEKLLTYLTDCHLKSVIVACKPLATA